MTSLSLPSVQPVPHWRAPLLALAGFILALLLAYRETAAGMVEIWSRSQTFTHAFLVPPIVLWLVWTRRAELAHLQPRPAWSALLPMVAMAVMWWLGALVEVNAAVQFAMTAMVVAAVPLVLGWQVARTIAFPLAFLFFAVPIGEFMEPTLMHWTAEALVAGLRLTGVPVHQEGQQLVIPTGRWEVVAACSGIRYLMATLMAGSLFAYLNYTSTRKRLVFAAVSIMVPLVANWLRAYIIVMLGHLSNNQIATGVDHLVYGWVFFGLVIMALFYVGARFADDPPTPLDAPAPQFPARPVGVWATAALVAAAAALWPVALVRTPAADARAPVQLSLPDTLGAWTSVPVEGVAWRPNFEGAADRALRVYRAGQGTVVVDAAYYPGRVGTGKLVSSVNTWLGPAQVAWNAMERGPVVVPLAGGGQSTWRRAALLPPDGSSFGTIAAARPRLMAWRVYAIGGHLAHNDMQAKLLQAWRAVRGLPDDGVALHVWTIAADDDSANKVLSSFVAENLRMLQESFARAAAPR